MVITGVTYRDPKPIVRSSPGLYPFIITLSLLTATYDVITLKNGFDNYNVTYAYSDTDITNHMDFQNMTNHVAQLYDSSSQIGFAVGGTHDLQFNVIEGMSFMDCASVKFVCFLVESATYGSFTDSDYSTNIKCYDMEQDKSCEPSKHTIFFKHNSLYRDSNYKIFIQHVYVPSPVVVNIILTIF